MQKLMRIKDSVVREQVDVMFRFLNFILLGEILGATFYVNILWQHISHDLLMIWFFLIITINCFYPFILTISYTHAKKRYIKNIVTWRNFFLFAGLFSGFVWGISAFFITMVPTDFDQPLLKQKSIYIL